MSQTCQAIIFACMDCRLHADLHRRADEKYGPTGYDLIHVAGGGGSLISPDAAELMLKQIELSVRLHGSTKVVLVNHEDCGAYGGKGSFADDQAERAKHQTDLAQAAQLIRQHFPELAVTTAFQRLDGVVILFDGQSQDVDVRSALDLSTIEASTA